MLRLISTSYSFVLCISKKINHFDVHYFISGVNYSGVVDLVSKNKLGFANMEY